MIWIWIAFIAAKSEALSSAVTKAKNVVTPNRPSAAVVWPPSRCQPDAWLWVGLSKKPRPGVMPGIC